jgi:putative ABC transport system permease protein
MIKFLLKGILRDRNRSILPVIVVTIGVFLTVMLNCWITGILSDIVDMNAAFTTGHVKVMTRAYAKHPEMISNDLALTNVHDLMNNLNTKYPSMEWVERINFGGLIDIAGKNGETRAQGPAAGQAFDLITPGSKEVERMNIRKSIVSGRIPEKQGEILISDDFARRFGVGRGDEVTLFGSTMNNSMTFKNFKIAGTVRFGVALLDKGAILIDIRDAQQVFDMEDAAGEILGYSKENGYNKEKAAEIASSFNAEYALDKDDFAPRMVSLRDQNNLATYIDFIDKISGIMVTVFVFAMSIVLWNTGLLGGLRRYNEFGLRLAMGEEKGHIYKTLIYESVLIGLTGSVLGTTLGLWISYALQKHGLDFSSVMKNSSMMTPAVFRAIVTPPAYYIGFIPGLFSIVIGTALSGIGIYKRKTAQLFKELEV